MCVGGGDTCVWVHMCVCVGASACVCARVCNVHISGGGGGNTLMQVFSLRHPSLLSLSRDAEIDSLNTEITQVKLNQSAAREGKPMSP